MKLYYAPAPSPIAVAIALQEAGLAYEPVSVDFASARTDQTDPICGSTPRAVCRRW